MIKYFLKYFFLLIYVFVLFDCANVGSPSGGAKDTQAPKILKSEPNNLSINFTAKTIKIDFDEYVKLNKIGKKFITSPPLKEVPDIKIKNKSVIININNILEDSTTYTFNFNDAIVDVNEGNALNNFKYVFSTGDIIDTLKVSGKILNSFDLEPKKNVFVMLYKNLSDTMPLKQKPYYITKTDKNGNFELTNLAQNTYRIFALDDKNSNFVFDLPNESIAFIDSFIYPKVSINEKIDTVKIDSLDKDTVIISKEIDYSPKNINLKMFDEKHIKQYIVSNKRLSKEKIQLIFNSSLSNDIKIKQLANSKTSPFLINYNNTRDTVNVWITDSLVYNLDTLNLIIESEKTDSLENIYLVDDTIKFPKPTYLKNGKQHFNNNFNKSLISSNLKDNSQFDIYKKITLIDNVPFLKTNFDRISLYEQKDTSFIKKVCKISIDSTNANKIIIDYNFKESTKYKLIVNDSSIINIYNNSNDSVTINFTTTKLTDYGLLKINFIAKKTSNYIIQLLDSKKNVVQEKYIKENNSLVFSYLKPGKYNLKLIYDTNNNKIWDTGNYKKNIQPEKVIYFEKELDIRPNWDLEETWEIKN